MEMLLLIHNPRFRLLWVGGLFSDMSISMYILSHGWLALAVTDSAFWVGATAGMGGIGLMLFSALSGVMVDRMNRRTLMLVTQVVQAALVTSLAVLIFADQVELWQVLLVAFADGALMSIKIPARMALVLDVAGRENMLKANAATFVAMTTAGIAMPLVAGQVVSSFGIGWVYLGMACAFVASDALLLLLRGVEPLARKNPTSPLYDLKEGLRFVFTTPSIRMLILMILSSEIFGWAHETILPVMAGKVLDVGPAGLGYLISAGSAGALASSLTLSAIGEGRKMGRMLVVGYLGFGFCLILFAMSPWFLLSLVLIAAAYSMGVLYETALSTLLQTTVPNEMRGRVLSFQAFTWGVTGTSGFHMGALAAVLGAPVAIALGGGVLLVNGVRLARRVLRLYGESAVETTESNEQQLAHGN